MAEIITRTIQINGTDVAIKTTGQLKQAVKLLNTEIDKADTGTPPYNKLIKQLGTVKALQQVNRNEVRNFKNETLAAGKTATGAYDQLSKRLLVTRQRYKDLAAAGRQGTKEAKELLTTTQRLDTRLKQIDSTVGQNQRNVGNYLGSLQGFGKQFLSVLGVGGALAIGARLLQSSARTVLDFDSQLIAVSKTTDLAGSELEKFSLDVRDLGGELDAISIQGLLDSSEIAGQLGIRGSGNILKFSKTIEQLKLTSDIVGEESARNFAKFIEVSDDSVENADRLGSVITILGNNFATTENAILKNSTELAKGVAVYDTSAQGLLAIGAATSALGSEAEQTRSAVQLTFNVIDQAITTGEGLEDILRLTGLTEKQLSEQFQRDASGVFVKFVKGLNEAKNSGENLREILSRLDIDEKRAFTVVGALAANYDTLADSISFANQEYIDNTALSKESERAADSLRSKIGDVSDAWSGFILSVEDGDGPISEVVKLIAVGAETVLQNLTGFNQGLFDEFLFGKKSARQIATETRKVTAAEEEAIDTLSQKAQEFVNNGLSASQAIDRIIEASRQSALDDALITLYREAGDEAEVAKQKADKFIESLRDTIKLNSKGKATNPGSTDSTDGTVGSGNESIVAGSVKSLREQLKSLREEREASIPGSQENIRLNKEITATQEKLNSALGKTTKGKEELSLNQGSLAFLKKEASDLRKEIEENRTADNPLKDKIEELIGLEADIDALESSLGDIQRRIDRTGSADGAVAQDTLAPISTIGNIDLIKTENQKVEEAHNETLEKMERATEISNAIQNARDEQQTALFEEQQEKRREIVDTVTSSVQSGFQAAFDIRRNQIDQNENSEISALENVYARRIEAAEGNTAEQERLEAELEQRRLEIQRKAFEDRKRLSIREALINGALAITQALANTTLPFPLSLTAAIPVAASTAAQVAIISAQQFEAEEGIRVEPDGTLTHSNGAKGHVISNGRGKKGVNNFTPKYILERGGRLDSSNFFRGASHEGGGIKTFLNGVPVEVENGEFADVDEFNAVNVINRIDSTLHRTALRQQAGKIYSGKADFLNSVNSGHGRSFAKEGIVIPGVNNALADNRNQLSSIINVSVRSNEIAQAVRGSLADLIPGVKQAVQDGMKEMSPELSQSVFEGANAGTNKGIADSSREQRREDNFKRRQKI